MIKKMLLLGAIAAVTACANSHPHVRQQGSISRVTYPVAFGNYSRVYNTTYHIVNRYAVVKRASYRQGVIEAELDQDTHLFEKTRRTVLARLFDAGDYWDVECRVLIEVEDSDVETLRSIQPRYRWRTVSYDQFLETRLNNEIKAALSGGAWQSKAPLKYKGVAALSAPKGVRFQSPPEAAEKPPAQKTEAPREPASGKDRGVTYEPEMRDGLNPREYERLGVHFFAQGAYPKARNAFQSALTGDAASANAHFLLALCHFAEADEAAAARALEAGFEHKDAVTAWDRSNMDLRSFYEDPTVFVSQKKALEARLTSSPKNADARLLLGFVNLFTRDVAGARDELSLVSIAAPDNAFAKHYLRLANVRLALEGGKLREF